MDHLYAPSNQSKTQGFLKSNGFPTAGDRQGNRKLYGVEEERRQVRDLLKSKTNDILSAKLPTENDRAFLHGLMGDKDGEREYQSQLLSAIRAQSDLQNTFRGSQFESGLKPLAQTSDSLHRITDVTDDTADATNEFNSFSTFDSKDKWNIAQFSGKEKISPRIENDGYNDSGNVLAYGEKKTESETKKSGSYIPLRSTIEGFGGKVQWDNSSKKAKVTLDGYTVDVYQGDGKGSFIQNETMYVWDEWFFPLIGMGIEFELGKGWVGRIEQHGSNDGMKRHVVVSKNGEEYAQNDDGSPHDGTKGNPPKSVLKALKEKKGWDWDGKQNDWLNKIQVHMPDGYTIFVDYPDGSSILIPYGNSIFYHTPTNKELIEYYSNPPIPYPTQNSSGDIVPIWFMPNPVPMPVTIPTPTLTPAPIFVP